MTGIIETAITVYTKTTRTSTHGLLYGVSPVGLGDACTLIGIVFMMSDDDCHMLNLFPSYIYCLHMVLISELF